MSVPSGPSSPASSGSSAGGGAPRRSREVTVLAVLLAVAVVIIGLLLMRQPSASSPTASPTSAGATAGGGTAAAGGATGQQGKVRDTARRKEGDPLAIGKVDAPVVMVEYADYACPFCAKWALETQPALVQRYVDAGVLRIEWHDLVIFGDKSHKAALAARAAGQQGKFWEFHHALFAASPTSGHPDLTDATLRGFAQAAGVPDLDRWQRDLADPALAQAVRTETQTAQSLGASSTPVFIINGTPLVGAQPAEAFQQVIDQAAGRR